MSDELTIELVIRGEDREAWELHALKRSRLFRSAFAWPAFKIATLPILLAYLVLALLSDVTLHGHLPELGVLAILVFGWFGVLGIYFLYRIHVARRALHRDAAAMEPSNPMKLTASKAGIHVSGSQPEVRFAWSEIREIDRTERAIYLYVDAERALAIPRHCFHDEDSYRGFEAKIRQFREGLRTN